METANFKPKPTPPHQTLFLSFLHTGNDPAQTPPTNGPRFTVADVCIPPLPILRRTFCQLQQIQSMERELSPMLAGPSGWRWTNEPCGARASNLVWHLNAFPTSTTAHVARIRHSANTEAHGRRRRPCPQGA